MASEKLSYPCYSPALREKNLKYPEIDGFEVWLTHHRGVRWPNDQLSVATCFLDFLTVSGKRIVSVSQKDIDDFISEQGAHYKRKTVSGIASYLRSFFRYLFFTGNLERDFSESVHRPYLFRGERDPRYLRPWQVKEVLSAAQGNNTVAGKRDYAILVLLAIYGLRGCEVSRLGLDDLYWKTRKLAVRARKCTDTLVLPLVAQTGRALAAYLSVRPASPFREVFLSTMEPFHPLKKDTFSSIAKRAIARCGIDVAHPGTQTFRFSNAQSLFQAQRPPLADSSAMGKNSCRHKKNLGRS